MTEPTPAASPRTSSQYPPLPAALKSVYDGMPAGQIDEIHRIAEALQAHARYRIVTHLRPDGDAIGSALALHNLLLALGKESRVYTAGPVGDQFDFMPRFADVSSKFDERYQPEVSIFVDCGDLFRASEDDLRRGALTINIDHHLGNPNFGHLNYVDPSASSAAEQVYHIARFGGLPLTREVAMCVYVGVLSDTGNFRYGNTAPQVFEIAAECCVAGANPSEIASLLLERKPPGALALAGRVLSKVRLECGGQLCWSELRQSDYHEAGGESMEPEGIVGELRGVLGVKMAILFHEMRDGTVRASLRSRNGTDCRAVAEAVGGGGHRNASGALVKKPYVEGRDDVLRAARAAFSRNGSTITDLN